jgi:hypothetical protein
VPVLPCTSPASSVESAPSDTLAAAASAAARLPINLRFGCLGGGSCLVCSASRSAAMPRSVAIRSSSIFQSAKFLSHSLLLTRDTAHPNELSPLGIRPGIDEVSNISQVRLGDATNEDLVCTIALGSHILSYRCTHLMRQARTTNGAPCSEIAQSETEVKPVLPYPPKKFHTNCRMQHCNCSKHSREHISPNCVLSVDPATEGIRHRQDEAERLLSSERESKALRNRR